ncbi:uncharacterized protein LOC120518333 isoform X3 [Polypterus senegalus]|uniref:uncharacterized protein LOC120518333 isoform X3 n=1 Tax=Polypterus senegalus TaxID=55291 RepID=UPI0019668346|nr:uncharacterized protein LOC120518333 isoform X3 [Polypterus senegalus]
MAAVRLFFCGKQTEKGYLAVSEKNIYQPMGTTVVLTTSISDDLEILNIEWSIFTNFTFIARYTPTRTRIDWIPEYRGRLSLSTNNGSLEIKDLKIEDSRKYTCMIRFKQREEYKDGIELKVYEPSKHIDINASNKIQFILNGGKPSDHSEFYWKYYKKDSPSTIVTAYSDGRTLPTQMEDRMKLDPDNYTLTIENVTESDSGIYEATYLNQSNKYILVDTFKLTVKGDGLSNIGSGEQGCFVGYISLLFTVLTYMYIV